MLSRDKPFLTVSRLYHDGQSLWHRCASKGTIDMCNLCDDECTRCWRKFKVNYKKHVIGIEVDEEKDDEEQLMKEAELV
jgi:hypothetical protein